MNLMLFVLIYLRPTGAEAFWGGVFAATIVTVVSIILRIIIKKTNNRKKWDDIDKK